MNYFYLKVTLIISLFVFLRCENKENNKGDKESKETVTNKVIKIKGSDTEFLMVKDLAEAYMAEHPNVNIIVEGGGSNKGIEALTRHEIDICNSSKELSDEEISALVEKKIDPNPIMFSVDALAIITNYQVGVDSLSVEQVSMLFSGQVKNWKELGGDNVPVSLYGRDKSSGTRDYFLKKFLSELKPGSIKECVSNAAVLNSVINNKGGIGYVGAGFLLDSTGKPNGKIWAMPVYIDNHIAISPYQSAAVKKGEYILTRPLYQYINGTPGELIEDFILFELTKRGQDIIMKHGFFPINDYQTQINRLKGLIK
jgi:phosphate transport system substrate-binding protein